MKQEKKPKKPLVKKPARNLPGFTKDLDAAIKLLKERKV